MDWKLRDARPAEASALVALLLRSKAVWGYDAAFMALAAPKLVLPEDWLTAGRVFVADLSGRLAGVAAIPPPKIGKIENLLAYWSHGAAARQSAIFSAKSADFRRTTGDLPTPCGAEAEPMRSTARPRDGR